MNPLPQAPPDRAWIVGLPKAEVHVHLEGCIGLETIVEAVRGTGEQLPDDPRSLLRFSDLADFLRFLDWSCSLFTLPDSIERLAYEVPKRLATSGTHYADLIVNPTHWPTWRDRLEQFVEALDRGLAAAEEDGLPPVGLCISLKRNQSGMEALALVDRLLAHAHPRVVALSIDGNEAAEGRTGERFAPAFTRAAEGGLRRCVHAGESSGPEGVRDAIDLLGAERVDHGVRAIEDRNLVDELAARRIPLDVCPTSNVTLGLAPILAQHPVDELRRAGVRVSLNTDDPVLFSTDLAAEYERTAAAFAWDRTTVAQVARTSIEASFAPPALQERLLGELDAYC